jgi:hypothetical protein
MIEDISLAFKPLSQSAREALLDLLTFAALSDRYLNLSESDLIEKLKQNAHWESGIGIFNYTTQSITRARSAVEEKRGVAYVSEIASRVPSKDKNGVYSALKEFCRADNDVNVAEQWLLKKVRELFNIDDVA